MKASQRFYYIIMTAILLCAVGLFCSNTYAAEQTPCSRDIARFCKNVNPDNDGLLHCLEEHAQELSKVCRDYEGQLDDVQGNDGKVVRAKTRKTKFPYVYR